MNSVAIEYVGKRGPHTGWAPAFQFSKGEHYIPVPPTTRQRTGPAYAGPMPPPTIRPRPAPAPGKADPVWDVALKTKFQTPITQKGMLQPHGSSMPWHAMDFPNRHTELSWLIQSQNQELASLPEEFRANGLSASSLSSSPTGTDDDDMEAANLAERHLKRVPYSPDPIEIAPVLRRIDWEKFIFGCSQANKIYLARNDAGQKTLRCTDRRAGADLPKFASRFAGMSLAEIEENRIRAAHYRRVVWSLMTPDEQLAWTKRDPATRQYLESADDNKSRENRAYEPEIAKRGPLEIGLDGDTELVFDESMAIGHEIVSVTPSQEPSEFDLWPPTNEEQVEGILPIETHIARAKQALAAWT